MYSKLRLLSKIVISDAVGTQPVEKVGVRSIDKLKLCSEVSKNGASGTKKRVRSRCGRVFQQPRPFLRHIFGESPFSG